LENILFQHRDGNPILKNSIQMFSSYSIKLKLDLTSNLMNSDYVNPINRQKRVMENISKFPDDLLQQHLQLMMERND
jgi:hypothetical protein